jgi:hypothetical protein
MTLPKALQTFVNDELMRAPLLIETAIDGALEVLRSPSPTLTAAERTMAADLLNAASGQRLRAVNAYLADLRQRVSANRLPGLDAAVGKPSLAAAPELSLVDEAEVAVDVVLSRAVETVRSVAEAELRELRAYTSALAGDMDVAGDHNPFRPEVQVRAVWAAAQALTPKAGLQVGFMRHATMPLAKVLKKSYGAACSRLANSGVEPAAYRTLILPAGTRTGRRPHDDEPAVDDTSVPDLRIIRETMPVPMDGPGGSATEFDHALQRAGEQWRQLPADTGKTEFGRLREAQRSQLVERAATPVDQQLIELLSRLFDAIVADRRLAPDMQALVSRLQASVLRVALRDPGTLDDPRHPVWLFIDRLAFVATTVPAAPDAERERLMRHAQAMIGHMIGEKTHDAALYEWARGRLVAFERNRHDRRVAAVSEQITALQAQDTELAMAPTPLPATPSTLDLQQLDTVPAELLDQAPSQARSAPPDSAGWLASRQRGDWLKIFLQGHWVQAELLWAGEHCQLWLFADGASQRTWAVRRAALLALHEAGLIELLKPRSLLRAAARRVRRQIESG